MVTGAAAQGLKLSSQALGIFKVCRGCGFGGCHCRLDRHRLVALLNELGVFAGKERLEELFDRMASRVSILDGDDLLGHRSSLAMREPRLG
jgi:hypothetical protein